jgi:putative transposase
VLVQKLEEVRRELNFLFIGWVLMPGHFHVLLKPQPAATTPLILKGLTEETVDHILKTLRQNFQHPWCRKMLTRLRLPPTVQDGSHYRFWQRRFYPFNVFSEKKRQEKLNYMHNNPAKRGLVSAPGDWPWSSWRFYYLQDASILAEEAKRCVRQWKFLPARFEGSTLTTPMVATFLFSDVPLGRCSRF